MGLVWVNNSRQINPANSVSAYIMKAFPVQQASANNKSYLFVSTCFWP